MKGSLSLVVAATALMTFSPGLLACDEDDYVGNICFTAASFCPQGYLQADGQSVSIQQYSLLYSVLGGGYNKSDTTFRLPDLRGRSPVGQAPGPNPPIAPLYQTRGADSTVLNNGQLPEHTHTTTGVTVNATTEQATSDTPTAQTNQLASTARPESKIYAAPGDSTTQVPLAGASGGAMVTLAVTGGGAAVPTVSPQLALLACVNWAGNVPQNP